MSNKDRKTLHRLLEEKLKSLDETHRPSRMLISERATDEFDEAQAEVERDLAVSFINTDWQVRQAVESALARFKMGEYGICESCGEPISQKRLRAIPWATRCATCQARFENDDGIDVYATAA